MKTLKNSISLVLAMMMVLSIVPVSVTSVFAENNDEYSYSILEDGSVQIDSYNSVASDVNIPSSIDGMEVSAIGEKAFEYNQNIISVELPESLKSIGERAFNECLNLKTVKFDGQLTTIGKNAFFSCTRLNDINLPSGLTTLGDGAFYDCQSLESIRVPGTVTDFGEYVFGNNKNLKTVYLDEGITSVPPSTFFQDSSLVTVELPQSLEKIERKAFWKCEELETIEIPSFVKEIGNEAFKECSSLKNLVFNGEKIGDYAFSGCRSFELLELSDNLRSIGKGVLQDAELSTVNIPKNVDNISMGAFTNSRLTNIIVAEENEEYTAENGVLYNKDMTKLIAYLNGENETYTMPESVTEVCDYAFTDSNSSVNSVVFSDNLKKIGVGAFMNSMIKEISLPDSLEVIEKEAFRNSSTVNLTVASGVKEISESAFKDCYQLETVVLSEGVEVIDKDAFCGCSSLTSFTLPNSADEISGSSFYGTKLADVLKYNGDKIVVKDRAIYNKDYTKLIMISPKEYDGEEQICVIPNTVTAIGDCAIEEVFNIAVYIPSSVQEISENNSIYTNTVKIIGEEGTVAQNFANKNDIAFFTSYPKLNSESISINGGETFKLALNGSIDGDVIFNTSDSGVATVDSNGTVTGVGKGTTKVIASVSDLYFVCSVTVNSDSVPLVPKWSNKYTIAERNTISQWEHDYYSANEQIKSYDKLDFPAIYCYSTEAYVPIVAFQKGGSYLERALDEYGEDYKQFELYSDNLSYEIQKFKLHKSTVFYSGTSEISTQTGAGSTLKDMKNSIGRVYVDPAVISTSASFAVTNVFGSGKYKTVLEVYTPENFEKCAYIQTISDHVSEYEMLFDKQVKFEVVDAGYKEFKVQNFENASIGEGGDKITYTISRFVSLKVIDDSVEPDATESTTVKSTDATSGTAEAVTSASTTLSTTVATKSVGKSSVATGTNGMVAGVIILFVISTGVVLVYLKRKNRF